MKNITINFTILGLAALFLIASAWFLPVTLGAEFPREAVRPMEVASTTQYVLAANATATRIIATSTPTQTIIDGATVTLVGRSAVKLQPVNCAASATIWVEYNDTPATTSTASLFMTGSTTPVTLGSDIPMAFGSLRASASVAGCSLNVTEFRTRN